MTTIATLTLHTSPATQLELTEDELLTTNVDPERARDLEAHIRAFLSELPA